VYEKCKDKVIPLQAWTGLEGSRRIRLTRVKSITKAKGCLKR
jgi:hypothetical protein